MQTIITDVKGFSGIPALIEKACKEWELEQEVKALQEKIDTVHSILSGWNEGSNYRYSNILHYLKSE